MLALDCAVRAYPPTTDGSYWRIRWEEAGRRRDTTARTRGDAVAKATDLVERLARGSATAMNRFGTAVATCSPSSSPSPVGASAAPISSGSWTKRPPPRWPSTCGAASAAWSPPGSTRDTSYPARTCSGGALERRRRRPGAR